MPRAIDGMKVCTKCGEDKPVSEYCARAKYGLQSWCRDCISAGKRRHRDENRGKDAFKSRKHDAKEKDKVFTLDYERDVRPLTNGVCYYSGLPFSWQDSVKGNKTGARPDSFSLDAVDPNGGYTPENVVACLYRFNTIKSDGTAAEHRMIADRMDSHSRGEK